MVAKALFLCFMCVTRLEVESIRLNKRRKRDIASIFQANITEKIHQQFLRTTNNGREAVIVMFAQVAFRKFLKQEIEGMLATGTLSGVWETVKMKNPERNATAAVRTREDSMVFGGDRMAIELTGMNLRMCEDAQVTAHLRVIDHELWLDNVLIYPKSNGTWMTLQRYTGLAAAQQAVNGAILAAVRTVSNYKTRLWGKKCFCSVEGNPKFNVYMSLKETNGHFGIVLSFSDLESIVGGAIDYSVQVPFQRLLPPNRQKAQIGLFMSDGLWNNFFGASPNELIKKTSAAAALKATSGINLASLFNFGLRWSSLADDPQLQYASQKYQHPVNVDAQDSFGTRFGITGFMATLDATNEGTSVVSAIWGRDEIKRFLYDYDDFESEQVFRESILVPTIGFPNPSGRGVLSFDYNSGDFGGVTEAKQFCDSNPQCLAIVKECDSDRRRVVEDVEKACAYVPRSAASYRQIVLPHMYRCDDTSYPTQSESYSGSMEINVLSKKIGPFESCAYMKCPKGQTRRPEAEKNNLWCEGRTCDKTNPQDINKCCWPKNSVRIFMGANPTNATEKCAYEYYNIFGMLPRTLDTVDFYGMKPSRPLTACELCPDFYLSRDINRATREVSVRYEEYSEGPVRKARVCVRSLNGAPVPEDYPQHDWSQLPPEAGLCVRCTKTFTRPDRVQPDQCRAHLRLYNALCGAQAP